MTTYAEPSDQEISYEINFSQTSVVNTQARDAISTDIYRTIDYIEQTINAVEDIEKRISDVDNMIENTTDETELENYNKLKEMLETSYRYYDRRIWHWTDYGGQDAEPVKCSTC